MNTYTAHFSEQRP